MNKELAIPTIDRFGEIDEAIVRDKKQRYRKAKLKDVELTFIDGVLPVMETQYEEFELRHLGFNLDRNRYCVLDVYVSTKFYDNREGKARDEAVELWIMQWAPWLFTYARRVDMKKAAFSSGRP